MTLDVARIRKDFPILERTVHDGVPLVYLDSANTSQKPRQVLDAMADFYERHNANIHRATHQLGEEATQAYEDARARLAAFIGAAEPAEVVFAKNISEAINLVAYAMGNASAAGQSGRFALGPGDEIVISEMEHHSNIVPWQLLCQRTGATLRWFGVTADGRLDTSGIDGLITERTKLVAVAHQSNVLGTVNPIRALADRVHAAGALLLVDAAQSVPQMPVDVAALGADFLGFTAADYLSEVGRDAIAEHEHGLVTHALAALAGLDGLRILGPAEPVDRGAAVSFTVEGVHPHDVSQVLDARGIAVRAGHHCAWPLHRAMGVQASTRASFYLYNTHEEVDALAAGIAEAQRFFGTGER